MSIIIPNNFDQFHHMACIFRIFAEVVGQNLSSDVSTRMTQCLQEWLPKGLSAKKVFNEIEPVLKELYKNNSGMIAFFIKNSTQEILETGVFSKNNLKSIVQDLIDIAEADDLITEDEGKFINKISEYFGIDFSEEDLEEDDDDEKYEKDGRKEYTAAFMYSTKEKSSYLDIKSGIPTYPGEFYLETKKYHLVPIKLKRFPRFKGVSELFRKFKKDEVEAICNKIKETRTIPILCFIRNVIEDKFDATYDPFWFIPFVIAAEKIGCFVCLTDSGFWANAEDESEMIRLIDSDVITSLTYTEGFNDEECGNEDTTNTVSTLYIHIDEEFLTLNEFHGEEFGSQLLIIDAIWDLWSEVVEHGRGSEEYEFSFHPYEKNYTGAPSFIEFNSWAELIHWSQGNDSIEKSVVSSTVTANEVNRLTTSSEAYKRKIKEALADGVVTDLEKVGLDFFQHKLKLRDEDALRIFEEALAEMQEISGGEQIKTRTDVSKKTRVIDPISEETYEEGDLDRKAPQKRISYVDWSEFEREQGAKGERKKANLPIANKIHEFIINVLKENHKKYEIRYGDGTFSFSMPREEAKSGKRTFARVGLLSLADKCVYLDTLYKNPDAAIPSGGIPWGKNDQFQYVFREKSIDEFEKLKNSIRKSLIDSYNYLATV